MEETSTRQFFSTSERIFLMGQVQTGFEKPPSGINVAIFPLRLLTIGSKESEGNYCHIVCVRKLLKICLYVSLHEDFFGDGEERFCGSSLGL
jgi:hypothetical protein